MKIYRTKSTALENIRYKDNFCAFNFNYIKKTDYDKERYLEERISFAIPLIRGRLHGQTQENKYKVFEIFGELVMNSYRHVTNEKHFTQAVTYFGKKGVLIGTIQNNDFLKSEQIELLKAGMRVPSTKSRFGGGGTDVFIDSGDGIYIDETKKAIYISIFFKGLNLSDPE